MGETTGNRAEMTGIGTVNGTGVGIGEGAIGTGEGHDGAGVTVVSIPGIREGEGMSMRDQRAMEIWRRAKFTTETKIEGGGREVILTTVLVSEGQVRGYTTMSQLFHTYSTYGYRCLCRL